MPISGDQALVSFQESCRVIMEPTNYSSWRVPTCNTRILLHELFEACEVALNVPASRTIVIRVRILGFL